MRDILWGAVRTAKFNSEYTCLLLGHRSIILNRFNIVIGAFSAGGIMGWKIWELFPVIACIIVAGISLMKALESHIIPSDKHIQKLDKISDFYYDYFLKFQLAWFDYESGILTDIDAMKRYQDLKQLEREINKITNEVHKKPNKAISLQAKALCDTYFKEMYKTAAL